MDEHLETLSYLPSINRFADLNGVIVHDLYKLFDLWQLDQWKKMRKNEILDSRDGRSYLLEYLDEDDEDDVFQLMGWNESFGIQMSRQCY